MRPGLWGWFFHIYMYPSPPSDPHPQFTHVREKKTEEETPKIVLHPTTKQLSVVRPQNNPPQNNPPQQTFTQPPISIINVLQDGKLPNHPVLQFPPHRYWHTQVDPILPLVVVDGLITGFLGRLARFIGPLRFI